MDFEMLLRPETITAVSISMGALVGGVVAVIAEFRRPDLRHAARHPPRPSEAEGDARRLAQDLVIREECEHLNRSIWIVEKKVSDRLARIEAQLATLSGAPAPQRSPRRITSASGQSSRSSSRSDKADP